QVSLLHVLAALPQKFAPSQISAKGGGVVVVLVVVVVVGGTQTPFSQVEFGFGQSAGVPHKQRWWPVASLGPQFLAQQLAFSRQRPPGTRQPTASARPRPTAPSAPATRPARTRRRLPGTASALVSESKRDPSIDRSFPGDGVL